MADEFEVKGLKELDEKLDGLAADMQWKILRTAGNNAMKPVLDDMKNNAPVGLSDEATGKRDKRGIGHLRNETKRWSQNGKKTGIGWIHVGYRSRTHVWQPKNSEYQFQIAQILEEGTDKIAPRGWMRRAMDNNVNTILKRLTIALQKRIAKFEKTGK